MMANQLLMNKGDYMKFFNVVNKEINEAKSPKKPIENVSAPSTAVLKKISDEFDWTNGYTEYGHWAEFDEGVRNKTKAVYGILLITMEGSSLKSDIKECFKKLHLDKDFNIKHIGFCSYNVKSGWGGKHSYFIPQLTAKEKSGKAPVSKSPKIATVDEIADEAQYQADKWMPEVDFEELEGMSKSELKAEIEGLVDKYIEEYYQISSYDIEETKMSAIQKAVVKKLVANFS